MASKSPAVLAVIAFAVVVAIVAVVWWLPWLTSADQRIASTPAPRPLFVSTTVNATPTAPVCLTNVPVGPGDQVIAFTADKSTPGTPAVAIDLTAPGYRDHVTVPAGSYTPGTELPVAISPPPGPRVTMICVRPQTGTLALFATNEDRSRSRPTVTAAGKPVNASVVLTFYRRHPTRIIGELGAISRRAHVVAAPAIPAWLLLIGTLVAVLGLAPAIAWALYVSLREEPAPEPGP